MKISPVTKNQWLKVAKTAVFLAVSAVISYVAVVAQDSPELFGVYLPFVNLTLVVLKQVFTEK